LVVISEFLRSQQGIQQIDHQPGTYQQHDDRFSIHIDLASGGLFSANPIAELHISQRQREERDRDRDKDNVLHTTSSFSADYLARMKSAQSNRLSSMID
jgi:hypothetical protein